jgi:hypothetical protein
MTILSAHTSASHVYIFGVMDSGGMRLVTAVIAVSSVSTKNAKIVNVKFVI